MADMNNNDVYQDSILRLEPAFRRQVDRMLHSVLRVPRRVPLQTVPAHRPQVPPQVPPPTVSLPRVTQPSPVKRSPNPPQVATRTISLPRVTQPSPVKRSPHPPQVPPRTVSLPRVTQSSPVKRSPQPPQPPPRTVSLPRVYQGCQTSSFLPGVLDGNLLTSSCKDQDICLPMMRLQTSTSTADAASHSHDTPLSPVPTPSRAQVPFNVALKGQVLYTSSLGRDRALSVHGLGAIKMNLCMWKENLLVDIRFWKSDENAQLMVPTDTGVIIPIRRFNNLISHQSSVMKALSKMKTSLCHPSSGHAAPKFSYHMGGGLFVEVTPLSYSVDIRYHYWEPSEQKVCGGIKGINLKVFEFLRMVESADMMGGEFPMADTYFHCSHSDHLADIYDPQLVCEECNPLALISAPLTIRRMILSADITSLQVDPSSVTISHNNSPSTSTPVDSNKEPPTTPLLKIPPIITPSVTIRPVSKRSLYQQSPQTHIKARKLDFNAICEELINAGLYPM